MKTNNSEEYRTPSVKVFEVKISNPVAGSPDGPGAGEGEGTGDNEIG